VTMTYQVSPFSVLEEVFNLTTREPRPALFLAQLRGVPTGQCICRHIVFPLPATIQ
jgi:hypothetical protein